MVQTLPNTIEWSLILLLPVTTFILAWMIQRWDKYLQDKALLTQMQALSIQAIEGFFTKFNGLPHWNHRPIIVKDETCNGCGNCLQDCPANAIELIPLQGSDPPLYITLFLDDRCIQCGICVHSCPFDVIGVDESQS